ncbi:ATP-binding cassette domain-containing protein [Prevotella sp. E13-27]|uniref:ATP-binding cassette domain-containing protein n=1 Tax=Prevotella sp. E13-27 TaxID=2938122 RepID=UPI00200B36F8|nr:ATP-binding cassette domain-containing protein [Prevotella sp. E13-27]MCK8623729.1 ATP-binding cassette domain-containing protein [Prevotella sp. E13-27]
MILELNDVLTENESHTLSFMASSGELMCITGGTAASRTRWLLAIQGFSHISHGYVCIDGEPLTERTAQSFRELMAYAPERLTTLGEVTKYEPPTVQDVFSLKANRDIPISNGILGEEMRRTGADVSDGRVQLLAVAVLLDKKILLVDNPPKETSGYLKNLAKQGKVVVVTSDEDEIISAADQVVEI